jgi:hypothetical protein
MHESVDPLAENVHWFGASGRGALTDEDAGFLA